MPEQTYWICATMPSNLPGSGASLSVSDNPFRHRRRAITRCGFSSVAGAPSAHISGRIHVRKPYDLGHTLRGKIRLNHTFLRVLIRGSLLNGAFSATSAELSPTQMSENFPSSFRAVVATGDPRPQARCGTTVSGAGSVPPARDREMDRH